MQPPPLAPSQAPSASCGLATASLILGILGLMSGPLTGIPAIITGHMALGRIRKSGGVMQGSGLAMAGLVMGYAFSILVLLVAVLGAVGYAAGSSAIGKARSVTTLATASAIESAVDGFHTEYGSLPSDAKADVTVHTDAETVLINALLGLDTTLNPRAVRFLSVREGRNNKNGLIYGADGRSVTGLYDPWGGGFHVLLDADGDGKLVVDPKSGTTVTGRRAVVWSDGPDRRPGTSDDVKTW